MDFKECLEIKNKVLQNLNIADVDIKEEKNEFSYRNALDHKDATGSLGEADSKVHISVPFDQIKNEEVDIKDEEGLMYYGYLDDNFDSIPAKDLYEDGTSNEFLMDANQLQVHATEKVVKHHMQNTELEALDMSVDTELKQFICTLCNRSFTRKSSLVEHNRIHSGEKPFKCDNCDKMFTQKSHLTYHSRRHTGEKPFKCDICDKGYAHQSHLIYHMKRHTGEKSFKCDICNKRFAQKSHLRDHTRRHAGEKHFNCDTCGKGFIRKSDLVDHVRIHTGIKPFICDICDKRFVLKSNLVKHIGTHRKKRRPVCV